MSRAMPWGSGGGAGNRSPSGFRPDAGSKPAYFCQSERRSSLFSFDHPI